MDTVMNARFNKRGSFLTGRIQPIVSFSIRYFAPWNLLVTSVTSVTSVT
jgi:hypothetical protein